MISRLLLYLSTELPVRVEIRPVGGTKLRSRSGPGSTASTRLKFIIKDTLVHDPTCSRKNKGEIEDDGRILNSAKIIIEDDVYAMLY